jgi:hypothetical protein
MSDEELVVWSAPTEGAATQWDGVLTSPHPIAQAVRFLADRTARASAGDLEGRCATWVAQQLSCSADHVAELVRRYAHETSGQLRDLEVRAATYVQGELQNVRWEQQQHQQDLQRTVKEQQLEVAKRLHAVQLSASSTAHDVELRALEAVANSITELHSIARACHERQDKAELGSLDFRVKFDRVLTDLQTQLSRITHVNGVIGEDLVEVHRQLAAISDLEHTQLGCLDKLEDLAQQRRAAEAEMRRLQDRIDRRATTTSLARVETATRSEFTAVKHTSDTQHADHEAKINELHSMLQQVKHETTTLNTLKTKADAQQADTDAKLQELHTMIQRVTHETAKLSALQGTQQTRFVSPAGISPSPAAAPSAPPAFASAPTQQPFTPNDTRSTGSDLVPVLSTLAALIANKRGPGEDEIPRTFKIHEIRTYHYFIREHGLRALDAHLRLHLDIRPKSRGATEYEVFWAWVEAVFGEEEDDPPEVLAPAHVHLGTTLLRSLRIAAAGANPTVVASALAKEDFGSDTLGLALATQGRPSAKAGTKVTCWHCGKKGHSAKTCVQRIADGAPVPTAPKTPGAPKRKNRGPGE